MRKTLLALFAVFVAVSGSGCATPYEPESVMGGYSHTRLSENIFTVTFRGNGYTTRERATDFSLLRSAEIGIANSYDYFIIIGMEKYTDDSTFTTPTTSYTSGYGSSYGTVNMYGDYGRYRGTTFGSVTTTTYGGQTFLIAKPTTSNTILCLNEKPEGNPFVFDAGFLAKSIIRRYGLDRGIPTKQTTGPQYSAYRPRPRDEPVEEKPAARVEPRAPAAPEPIGDTRQRPRLVVKGIAYSKSNASALIGGEVVHEGDTVSGAQVVKITRDTVEFEMNGTTWTQGVSR